MGVIPAYRSQGVGQKLMEECMDWAKKSGYQKLFVNSYFANKKAVSFYERCGFRPIDLGLEVNV
jgi:GNAT superfamily N-acetyltransferase